MVKELSRKANRNMHLVLKDIYDATMDNPIKSQVMEKRWNISGTTVREIVHHLRTVDRKPICSDANGYFYAKNRAQAEHTLAQLRSRVKQINEAASALEECFKDEIQGTLWG